MSIARSLTGQTLMCCFHGSALARCSTFQNSILGRAPRLVSAAKSEMPRQIRCSTLFVGNYFGPVMIIFLDEYVWDMTYTIHVQQI